MAWSYGLLLLLAIQAASFVRTTDIGGVKGKGDYREILVSWDSPVRSLFVVHYCELQAWGSSRCKSKNVESGSGVEKNGSVAYSALLDGLRMSTNYSISVEEGRRGRRLGPSHRTIVVSTKGFSARAVSCLPEVSEVEVETGPYFHGRIGVESGKCSVDGEPDSPRATYLLRIRHQDCGSTVNETAASTFVIVQESSHILTHSTRRFLVLCTFQPETLTVRAGLNLPHTADGMVEPSLNDISENEVHAAPLRLVESSSEGDGGEVGGLLGGVAGVLALAAVGSALWRYRPSNREENSAGNYDNLESSTPGEVRRTIQKAKDQDNEEAENQREGSEESDQATVTHDEDQPVSNTPHSPQLQHSSVPVTVFI